MGRHSVAIMKNDLKKQINFIEKEILSQSLISTGPGYQDQLQDYSFACKIHG